MFEDSQDAAQVQIDGAGRVALIPSDRVAVAVIVGEGNEVKAVVKQGRVMAVEGDMVFVSIKGDADVRSFDRDDIRVLYRSVNHMVTPLAISSKIR